jgi:hypothetical protein
VCIVKEDVEDEVAAFAADVWPGGEIYLDKDMTFFKALGGGSVEKKGLFAFLAKMVLPGTQLKANMKKGEGYKMNLKGEGLIVGGLYVLRTGGAVEFSHREEEIGSHADVDDVITAATRASEACQTD